MKKLSAFLILIFLAIIFIFSCQKDKTYTAGESNNLRTTVTGIVLDESNAPLNGVTVTAYGQTTTTNQYGTFVLKNLTANKDRCVLEFSKTGFFKRSHGFIASANTVNYVRIILVSNTSSQNFSSSTGGTVSLTDGSSAEFQPNSFVTSNGTSYTGTVNIAIKHLSPDDANFGFMIPGGDLLGKDLNDKDVALYTYGMLGVELTGSSGEALQLASGSSATLTFAIAASQLSSAPASIPLWYFDEATSLWKEEGAANKVGNNYVGTVAHFSWWNCDYSGPRAYLKGKVVDCNGIPMPNVYVTVNGWYVMTTDQNGEYYDAVHCGMTFTVQVVANTNSGMVLNSQIENVSELSPNQNYLIPNLIVPCPSKIAGIVQTCNGENTSALVSVSSNGFINFQYTLNGSFSLNAIPSVQLNLNANNENFLYHQIVSTLPAPQVLTVGNILLCDTISSFQNYFIIDGGPFSNQLFNVVPSTIFATTDSLFELMISISGMAFPDYTLDIYEIVFDDTIPGIYYLPSSYASSHFYNSTNNYHIGPDSGNFMLNLTEMGPIGGKIKGNYSGNATLGVNQSNMYSVNFSGSFDVIRTQ